MRKNRFKNPFQDNLIYRFAEEAGEGTAEGDGTDTEFDPKAYAETTSATITNIQKELANSRNATKKELANLQKTIADLAAAVKGNAQQAEDTGNTDDGTEEETPTKPTKTHATKTTEDNPEITEMKKTLTTLQKQLESEKKRGDAAEERSKTAEQRRLNADRDSLLIKAASDANAIVATDAAKWLREYAVYDEDTESWGIKDGDSILDMDAGVKKFLPNYMIKPKTTRGGGGGSGTTGEENGANKVTLRQNAINMGLAAKKNPALAGKFERAKNDYKNAGGNIVEVIEEVAGAIV